jgi:hypothetical protein
MSDWPYNFALNLFAALVAHTAWVQAYDKGWDRAMSKAHWASWDNGS